MAQLRQEALTSRYSHAILDPRLLLVALLWGGNLVAYKFVFAYLKPLAAVGFRFALMAPMLLVAARLLAPSSWPAPGQWWPLVWAGLVVMAGQQISFIFALDWTTATEAALLISTAPLFTGIIAAATGQEKMTPLRWAGCIIAFCGVAAIVLGGNPSPHAAKARIPGDLLMLFSAVLYGYFMVLARELVPRYGGLPTVAICSWLASLVLVPISIPSFYQSNWAAMPACIWALFVGYVCCAAGVVAFVIWYTVIGQTSAPRTAVYQYLVPVVAMVAAAIFLGEKPKLAQLAGAVIVILGVAMARWQPRRQPNPP